MRNISGKEEKNTLHICYSENNRSQQTLCVWTFSFVLSYVSNQHSSLQMRLYLKGKQYGSEEETIDHSNSGKENYFLNNESTDKKH